MDASKKQREPVAFKSLAELKQFIRPGVEFKTVSHANHADMVGLTRVVTTVQTVGFYSKIKDQPEHPFSTCNHGKGFYYPSDWNTNDPAHNREIADYNNERLGVMVPSPPDTMATRYLSSTCATQPAQTVSIS